VAAAHVLFGAVESLYDLRRTPRSGGAAAASLGGHALVGAVTAWTVAATGSPALAIFCGISLHLGWNLLVTGVIGSVPEGHR
jgi:hypothetical protein